MAGVVAQILLGALVVVFELSPWLVIGHFVTSMVLVWNGVVLHHRAGLPTDPHGHAVIGPRVVAPRVLALVGVWFVGAMAVIFTGTIVTGSGPHGGDAEVERLPILFKSAARVHGSTVMAFLALTLLITWLLRRSHAPRPVQVRMWQVVGVLVVQATIGYVQYFTKVPVLLVGLHIAGATLLWITVVRFALATRAVAAADPRAIADLPQVVHA